MKLDISRNSNVAFYKQIYDQIKLNIINGGLSQGELLPSIRHLAKELNLSVITIKKGYSELEHDKYIVTRQGKGCYVSTIDLEKEFVNNKLNTEKKLKKIISESKIFGLDNEDIKKMFENILEKTKQEKRIAS